MKMKLSATQEQNLNFLRLFLIGLVLVVSARFLSSSIQTNTRQEVPKEIVKCNKEELKLASSHS